MRPSGLSGRFPFLNSLPLGGMTMIFYVSQIVMIDILCISCETSFKLMPTDLADDKSILVQVMAWRHLTRARPAVPLGLWYIISPLYGNFGVPHLHKLIKWLADK